MNLSVFFREHILTLRNAGLFPAMKVHNLRVCSHPLAYFQHSIHAQATELKKI